MASCLPYATAAELLEIERLLAGDDATLQPAPSLADFVHATCQFRLDPWQHVLCERLERLCTEQGQRILIHAPPQAGKPVWVGALVLMADGRRIPLADVSVGDVVISHRGRPCKVLAVHEQGERECVRITTNNGRSTSAALDHPFLTPEGWVNAGDLVPGQSLANVSEPECGGSTARADDEFEFLGYFMGDGACGPAGPSIQANVTSADPVQAARLMEVGARLGFACRVAQKQKTSALTYCFSGGVRDWLRNAGVGGKTSHFKTVPEWVFAGNRRQVALFLGAYFSCDGTVSPKGVGRNGEMRPDAAVEFYSVSQRLLQDVQSLLLRVGVQSRVSVKNARYLGNRHVSWRLSFKTLDAVAQFARVVPVPGEKGRKLRSLRACRKTFQPVLHGDPVVSVERVGLLPCRCLTVEADQTFTVDDLVVHNSVIISQRLPAYYLGRNPTGRVKLACYNITHATRFGKVGRDLMQDAAYRRMFPAVAVPPRQSGGEWSTAARQALADGQPSFAALGLATGFVGQGATLLAIDDPYAPLSVDTPVPTPSGWSAMGELKPGDYVFDHAGRPCKVTHVKEVPPARRNRVTFSDGAHIDAHPEHMWAAFDRRSHDVYTNSHRSYSPEWWQWKTQWGKSCVQRVSTRHISETLVARVTMRNWTVPTALPLDLPPADLPVDPYILGYWLGDGDSDGVRFTVYEDDVGDFEASVAKAGYVVSSKKRQSVGRAYKVGVAMSAERPHRWGDGLRKRLRELGVLGSKHVPAAYLRASREQRLALLQGLIDSDGAVQAEHGEAVFVNTDRGLIDGVCELLYSLGAKAGVTAARGSGYAGPGRGLPSWHVRSFTPFVPCRHPRKASNWKADGQIRRVNRTVVGVQELDDVVAYRCITVDAPSHLFLAGRAMIPTCNSPQDAASETIRESVWTFWDEAARVRLTDDANVVVMFHRYNEDDLAGRLMATDGLKEQGGKWELMRFAAVADGHGHDPMNRPVGEKLSPRWTDQYVADQQASGFAWDGQFQGLPGRKGGNMFQVDRLEFVAAAPALGQRCRGWDQAATAAGGDWTAGVKLCRGNDGLWYVEDVVRGQWDTAARNRVIRQTAELDGPACRVAGEQEPGSGGKDQAVAFVRLLAGFAAQVFPASGSKEVRADPLSAQVNAGNVRLVRGPWNKAFIDEVRQFPLGKNDDQVDAVAIAFRRLCRAVTVGAR